MEQWDIFLLKRAEPSLFFLQVLELAAPLRPFCSIWLDQSGHILCPSLHCLLPLGTKQEVCGPILGAEVLLYWSSSSWCFAVSGTGVVGVICLQVLTEASGKDGNRSNGITLFPSQKSWNTSLLVDIQLFSKWEFLFNTRRSLFWTPSGAVL